MIWQSFMFVGIIQVPGDMTLAMDEEHDGRNTAKRLIWFPDLVPKTSTVNCNCTKKYEIKCESGTVVLFLVSQLKNIKLKCPH